MKKSPRQEFRPEQPGYLNIEDELFNRRTSWLRAALASSTLAFSFASSASPFAFPHAAGTFASAFGATLRHFGQSGNEFLFVEGFVPVLVESLNHHRSHPGRIRHSTRAALAFAGRALRTFPFALAAFAFAALTFSGTLAFARKCQRNRRHGRQRGGCGTACEQIPKKPSPFRADLIQRRLS